MYKHTKTILNYLAPQQNLHAMIKTTEWFRNIERNQKRAETDRVCQGICVAKSSYCEGIC